MTGRNFLRTTVVLLTLGLLAGCGGPAELANLSSDDIREVSERELCEAYYYGGADNVRNEINRRQLIREPRWNQVDARKVGPGMSECAVLASLGTPNRIEARTDRDTTKVLVYRTKERTLRVHLKNDRTEKIEKDET